MIRARDQASRVLGEVGASVKALGGDGNLTAQQLTGIGKAMIGVGIAVGAVGAVGLAFYGSAAKAAMDYNQQSALTLTQVSQIGVSLNTVKDIGREVASQVAAPFDQLQPALYRIFSSMDVSAQQAQVVLTGVAKAAVAGQVDVSSAFGATRSIMNAYKLGVDDLNSTLDKQFAIVKAGHFTYDELSSNIGKAIPSAVKAGQSITDLGGVMAFLSRNGLSAAMSATSAARAMDLLSNPKFKAAMDGIGISVADATGNFRPMVDVMADLRKHFEGMSQVDIAGELKTLTTGAGGTIQAMRFLNLAVGDHNNLLGEMTDRVRNSAGAMSAAYDIMATQPASKLQQLKNNWQVLRTEIGDVVIPVLNRLISIGVSVLQWFQNLSPHMRNMIIWGGLIGSAFLLVAGILLIVAGGIAILIGTLAPLVGGIGAAILVIVGISTGLLALVPIGYAVYKNWDTIRAYAKQVWPEIRSIIGQFVSEVEALFKHLVAVGKSAWDTVQRDIHWLTDAASNLWAGFMKGLDAVVAFVHHAGDDLSSLWQFLADHTKRWWTEIGMIIDAIVKTVIAIVTVAIDIITWLWDHGLNHVIGILRGAWDIIYGVVKGAIEIIVSVISFFLDLITGKWSKLGEDLKGIWHGLWDAIQGILKGALGIITSAISGLWDIIFQAGKDIIQGLWQGILSMKDWIITHVTGFLHDIIPGPLLHLFGIHSPSTLMAEYGKNIIQGLAGGISSNAYLVHSAMGMALPNLPGLGGLGMGNGRIVYVAPGAVDLSNANINQDSLPGMQELLTNAVTRLVSEVVSR